MSPEPPIDFDSDSDTAAGYEIESEASAETGLTQRAVDFLLDFLLAPTQSEAESAWSDASQSVTQMFPAPKWGFDRSINPFTADGRPNLYKNEIPTDFRQWLELQQIDEGGYVQLVREVQYNSIQVWLESLFSQRQRSNKGWRLRIVGYPSLNTIAVGLSGNYQGSQAQNQIGAASALIRGVALDVLSSDTEARSLLESYPSATAAHWDDRGLMESPVTTLSGLDISSYGGVRLRMARNTTVKKEIATFFAIAGMGVEAFRTDIGSHLANLRLIAARLGEVR